MKTKTKSMAQARGKSGRNARLASMGLTAMLLGMGILGAGASAKTRTHMHRAGPASAHVSILLDWTPNTDHTGLYAALAQGYFHAEGVVPTISVPANPGNALEEVAAGRADFAVSYEPDVLLARQQGIPIRSVMALVDRPLNTIMSLTSSHITSARDLKGKSIGITGVPSDYAVVHAVLEYAHVPLSSVHLVRVGYNLLPALLHHRVNAVEGVYWTWEAVQVRQMGYRVNVLHLEQVGVPTYDELVLVTSNQLLRRDPSLVRRTLRAIQEGYAFAFAHPGPAGTDLLKETQGLSPKLIRASLVLLHGAFDYKVPTVGYQNPADWRRYMAWMVHYHLLKHPVSIPGAMSNGFLTPGIGANGH